MTVRREIGFQTAKEKGFVAAVRQDELLAKAVSTDGSKEWHCRFCSEANVETRAKRRRCKTDIPTGAAWRTFAGSVHKKWEQLVGFVILE